MKFHTTRFGDIEVPDDKVIEIVEGILGFPQWTKYVLLEHDSEGTPFKWLQAVENPDLAFIVLDPNLLIENYVVELDEEMAEQFGVNRIDEHFAMMTIVNIPHDDPTAMTVNLRAPIIVHLEKRTGCQVILPEEDYPIRHRLFVEAEEAEGEGAEEQEGAAEASGGKEDGD